ncbi:ABC transporter ATP-binding protein [Prosthecomicrobium pneumaticum]|uniref:Spermidine/putrescine transport system ATP-binding protein n=1 Tax=Prosthecomicrobium pneumaticum TaxID=81895 RepID=A0A7W9FIZ2_9HYPH|nr:ABC transporter ATP-binding protein [Prosthecomicrobium pneumaticum]MBB5751197.1 spermidine/putrescine transport system ATP-binding protein [Prosthecomicrobium pneumaticum]
MSASGGTAARGRPVELVDVEMQFGDFLAVERTSLDIRAGEFFSILGPSGCGKTTILRMISGFIEPTAGRVLIGGEDMAGRGPNARPTALIFQNLALFPLMSVAENVAFGLEARGMSKARRRDRAEELLALVGLAGQGGKKPSEMSGGQRQRVAIARALAVEPAVLLLDEPLSALDLKLRQHMRAELKQIQRQTGVTFVFITHDQGEALMMSDRIAVMRRGRVEQIGTADEIYARPATPFVATFVGENNVFRGKVTGLDADTAEIASPFGPLRGRPGGRLAVGDEAMLFVRPERMRFANGTIPDAALPAELLRRDLEGSFVTLMFAAGGEPIRVQLANGEADSAAEPGSRHTIGFAAADARVLPAGGLAEG